MPATRVASLLALTLVATLARPAAAALAPAARARMVASSRVGREVVAGLEAAGSVRVMVAFALPALGAAQGATSVRRARRLLAQARARLARGRKLARRAERKATVPAACASALETLLADAASRAR